MYVSRPIHCTLHISYSEHRKAEHFHTYGSLANVRLENFFHHSYASGITTLSTWRQHQTAQSSPTHRQHHSRLDAAFAGACSSCPQCLHRDPNVPLSLQAFGTGQLLIIDNVALNLGNVALQVWYLQMQGRRDTLEGCQPYDKF